LANPIALAAALSRMVAITCPHCRHKKMVLKKPAAHRTCPVCHKQFPDPLSAKRKK
jgi:ribosomal protein S27E